ncbi:MAG: rhomboid family intramembrane serine protease, partial [Planctomycetota bacterium]
LLSIGIHAQVEAENQDAPAWAIWVKEEDQVPSARAALDEFRQEPQAERYRAASHEASRLREAEQRRRAEAAQNIRHVRTEIFNRPATKRIPVTLAIVVLCVVLGILTQLGGVRQADPTEPPSFGLRLYSALTFQSGFVPGNGWASIRQGQLWRLFTPALLHGGPLHLAFNMLCLVVFGGQIEARRGWLLMLFLLVVTAVAGNVGQCLLASPYFVGMSGGVYGLFGYMMVRQRVAPQDGLRVSGQNIFILLVWLVLGFANVIPGIANYAHLFGLLMGMALAYVMPANRSWVRRAPAD